ncbi:MAG: biotin--[acetyl-CoA-carboxylase] ligase [Phycisphaerae bacterium]|mgnify:CR=1 FL=1|nr:biotin--[acetyl-CoA-carboxylase] ligase [Phycisphaerae bacterium]
MTTPIPLNIDRIEKVHNGCVVGGRVAVFKSTASTNDAAWQYALNPAHHGLCVLAEEQTKGRGRRGRKWQSAAGESILCSILLIDTLIEAELLTLTAAVAVAEAIRNCCGLNATIKWPNDILVNGRKLAGILVEKRTVGGRTCYVVGVGVNCNQNVEAFNGHTLRTPATSIRIETASPIDRTGLVCALLQAFEDWLVRSSSFSLSKSNRAKACTTNKSNPVIRRWMQLSTLLGRHVTVECDNQTFSGFCRGMDPAEGLIVQLDSGPVRAFSANHTSLIRAE